MNAKRGYGKDKNRFIKKTISFGLKSNQESIKDVQKKKMKRELGILLLSIILRYHCSRKVYKQFINFF